MTTRETIQKIRDYYTDLAREAVGRPQVREPHCPVCGKEIYVWGAPDVEYIETKRRTRILIHTACVRKWRE